MRAAGVTTITTADGRCVSVRRWSGEGRPFVLLHGLFDSSEGWAWLAERTSRPCVALDLPGFGGSDLPRRPRVASYADDIAHALAVLGIERCSLVGHSLGGAVAAEVAERSARVASLALLAPVGFGSVRLAEGFSLPVVRDLATLALPLALANPLTITAAYATFVAHGRPPERELVERLRARASCAPHAVRDATLAIAHAGRAPDALFRRALTFAGPVDAVWGASDALVPVAHAERVRAALPQARLQVWAGMGHHPQRERPGQLEHFLAAHARRADDAPPLAAAA